MLKEIVGNQVGNRSHPGAWNWRDYAAVDVLAVSVDFGSNEGDCWST